METGQYRRVLERFIAGEIELSKFGQLVEDWLFELRQNPEMTEEKELLSSIELYLHEAEEGQRSESEVYAHVRCILGAITQVVATPYTIMAAFGQYRIFTDSSVLPPMFLKIAFVDAQDTFSIKEYESLPAASS